MTRSEKIMTIGMIVGFAYFLTRFTIGILYGI